MKEEPQKENREINETLPNTSKMEYLYLGNS